MVKTTITFLSLVLLFVSSQITRAQVASNTIINSKIAKSMKAPDYTSSFLVSQSPAEVFKAVANVRGWWSEEIEGRTDALNEVFNYHHQDIHRTKMKIVEFVPDKKIVWHCEENNFNFTKDAKEWTGTTLVFEINKKGDQTEMVFTHIGLVPTEECYAICSDCWTIYIQGSLKALIETGKGKPNRLGAAIECAEN